MYQREAVIEVQFSKTQVQLHMDEKYFDIHRVKAFIGLISSERGWVDVWGVCVRICDLKQL